jgi:hypothetical protein
VVGVAEIGMNLVRSLLERKERLKYVVSLKVQICSMFLFLRVASCCVYYFNGSLVEKIAP